VENLFDTKKDEGKRDDEFTPEGAKKWTQEKYEKKLDNIAYVMSLLGKELTPEGVAIIGVAEVENRNVLEDLVERKDIKETGYKIVHKESPDLRGIDVALLYNPKLFKLNSYTTYPFHHPDQPEYLTRDHLLVSGELAGQALHIIVNHWPSRHGEASGELREYAALKCKQIGDSIYKKNSKAHIVIMGDMNDDPNDKSCRLILDAKKYETQVKPGGLFNTMWQLFDKGIGSLQYRGKWNLFDQIIISESLINKKSSLKFYKAEVFNPDFLFQKEGQYTGYPLRTFSGNTFLNGYSDHLPTLIYLRYN